jgi:hypothetical protein
MIEIVRSLPLAVRALGTLALGWILAWLVKLLTVGILTLIRMDRISERTGFSVFLRKGNVGYSPSRLGGVFAYWLVLIVTFVLLAGILDPGILESLAIRIRELLPGLAAALLISIVGLVGISFLANLARTIAQNAAVPNADLIGRAIKGLGYLVVVLMALDQVGLGGSILTTLTFIAFSAVALGSALAFGLGCKDLAGKAFARFLQDLRERDRESKGTDLEG